MFDEVAQQLSTALPTYALLTDIPAEVWSLGKDGLLATLIGLVILMILTGRLVPARYYVAKEKECDEWKAVAMKSLGHTGVLLPSAQITTEVVRALSDASSADRVLTPPGATEGEA